MQIILEEEISPTEIPHFIFSMALEIWWFQCEEVSRHLKQPKQLTLSVAGKIIQLDMKSAWKSSDRFVLLFIDILSMHEKRRGNRLGANYLSRKRNH